MARLEVDGQALDRAGGHITGFALVRAGGVFVDPVFLTLEALDRDVGRERGGPFHDELVNDRPLIPHGEGGRACGRARGARGNAPLAQEHRYGAASGWAGWRWGRPGGAGITAARGQSEYGAEHRGNSDGSLLAHLRTSSSGRGSLPLTLPDTRGRS